MDSIPSNHFESLSRHERTYWWHVSRLNWAEHILRIIAKKSEFKLTVDYGCGTGGFIHELSKRLNFESHLGVDISLEAIRYASKFGNHYKAILPGQLDTIVDADLVLLMDVLEHIKSDKEFLLRIVGTLQPNALVLGSVPAMPCLYSTWDMILGHYRRYTQKNIFNFSENSSCKLLYQGYAFSYLVPATIFFRKLYKNEFSKHKCEFPAVSSFINSILLVLNQYEISLSKKIRIPFGNSLFFLLQKNE